MRHWYSFAFAVHPTLSSAGIAAASAAALLLVAPVAAAQEIDPYTIVDLGTLGGSESHATALNERGEVVGWSTSSTLGSDGEPLQRAFLYSDGQMDDLGTLGGPESLAHDINESGDVTGRADLPGNAGAHAFLFNQGTMIDLGSFPAGFSEGIAISDDGTVVGSSRVASGHLHAFVATGGDFVDLGTLPGGNHSEGQGINRGGTIVGNSQKFFFGSLVTQAFRHDGGDLVDLGAPDTRGSQAADINTQAQVVGNFSTVRFFQNTNLALLWDGDTMVELGSLGRTVSLANAINDRSQIVGRVFSPGPVARRAAFLWQDGVMTDLNGLLPPSSGWTLIAASDINEKGQIVGDGTIGGETHAFLLSPPGDDLVVHVAELVQEVHGADALAAGKDTVVRVRVENSFDERVDTQLEVVVEPENGGTIIYSEDVSLPAECTQDVYFPDPAIDEDCLFGTALHEGNPFEPAAGAISVVASVDPDDLVPESSEENNAAGGAVTVKNTRPFVVLHAPLLVEGDDGGIDPSVSVPCETMLIHRSVLKEYLLGTYPVTDDEFSVITSCTPVRVPVPPLMGPPAPTPGGGLTGSQTLRLYRDLDALLWFVTSPSCPFNESCVKKFVATVRDHWFEDFLGDDDIAGIAFVPDPAVGPVVGFVAPNVTLVRPHQDIMVNFPGAVTAHEIGHTEGLIHLGAAVPAPGYWVERAQPIDDGLDFMGNFPSALAVRWIGPGTQAALLQRFKQAGEDPPVLGVRGFVFDDDTVLLEPWYRFEHGIVDVPLDAPGEFTLVYLDADNAPLAQTGFDVSRGGFAHGPTGPLGVAAFVFRVPEVPGTARIEIRRGPVTLAARSVSAGVPAIVIASPNGGEVLRTGDLVEVVWNSLDADGDPLVHVISISEDGGASWRPLQHDLSGDRYAFTVPATLVSDAVLLRVTASDGFNTAEDVTDATFFLNAEPPEPPDVDGDGVLDADDACVPSPAREVVNADGCAISDLCPCAHPGGMDRWKNHGAYVSCVAHATNDFVKDGLLAKTEKGEINSAAGMSSCGFRVR
jgi:probable HAF family extracellular repeat protein